MISYILLKVKVEACNIFVMELQFKLDISSEIIKGKLYYPVM